MKHRLKIKRFYLSLFSGSVLSVALLFSGITEPASAQSSVSPVQNDFNDDRISELGLAEIGSISQLSFSAVKIESNSSSSETALGTLGNNGDLLVPGRWISPSKTSLGIVTTSGGNLNFKVLGDGGAVSEKKIGTTSQTVIAAADLDHSGLTDAVLVKKAGRLLEWSITLDPFSPKAASRATVTRTYSFGFSNETPLFVRSTSGDLLATFTRLKGKGSVLRTFDLATGVKRRVALPAVSSSATPISVRLEKNRYALVFVDQKNELTLLTYLPTNVAKQVLNKTINAKGIAVVGSFAQQGDKDAEVVAIHSGTELLIHEMSTDSITRVEVPNGIAFDEINRQNFLTLPPVEPPNNPQKNPAPTPLPGPTATPTSVPTSIPPSGGTQPDNQALAAVCSKYTSISSGEMLVKSEISKHISSGDVRASGYTVVCATQCPQNLNYAPFYYANGELAGAVAKYGLFSGNGRPRMYGAVGDALPHNAREIAAKARGIGNGKLYLQIQDGSNGQSSHCKEFNPSGRNGSL